MPRRNDRPELRSQPQPKPVRVPPKQLGVEARQRLAAEDAARMNSEASSEQLQPSTLPIQVKKPKKGTHVHQCRVLTCEGRTDLLGRIMAKDSTGQQFIVDPSTGHDVVLLPSGVPALDYDVRVSCCLGMGDKILEVGTRAGQMVRRYVTLEDYQAPMLPA